MHGEDFLVNDGGNGQAVKAVGKSFPKSDVISPFAYIFKELGDMEGEEGVERVGVGREGSRVGQGRTFVVEAIYTVDARAFVVASKDEEVFWVFDLVGEEQTDGLERLLASVDVVSKK